MKSRILVSVLVTFLILAIFTLILSAGEVKYDFRKTNWGMSREQVKATEDKKPDFNNIGDFCLWHKVTINGKDFTCFYFFLKDKLYSSIYVFTGKYINKNLYIDDYAKLKKFLIKKYGKPKIEKIGLWKNDLYKDDRSEWGFNVSLEHLAYGDFWETSTTEIYLTLSDNYIIRLNISYYSKELKEWVKQTEEREALEDL